jgi:hypothetical protein
MHSKAAKPARRLTRADAEPPASSLFCLVATVAVLAMIVANVVSARYVGEPLPSSDIVGP